MTTAAVTPGAGATPQAGAQYLTFLLGTEVYALDIRSVREILQHGALTTVPLMPGFVRGVMNLRGAAVPVVDLGARLGLAAAPVGKKTCFVIVDACRGGVRAEVGLLVESVSAVIDIAPGDIEPPPDMGSSRDAGLIRGIGKLGQRFVVILDPDRICAAGEPPAPASTPRWTSATARAPQPA